MENSKEDIAWGEAARVRARLDAPDCSQDERARLLQWRLASPENERAFAHIESVSMQIATALDDRIRAMTERAFAAGSSLQDHGNSTATNAVAVPTNVTPISQARVARSGALRHPYRAMTASSKRAESESINSLRSKPRNQWRTASLAASVLVAAGAAWFGMQRVPAENAVASIAPDIYSALEKTPKQFTLADGSVVHLDVGARVAVDLSARERHIELLSGRAFFAVAHDAQRPFIVSANGTDTMALGTQFEVQLAGSQTQVTLLEGSVAVSGQLRADLNASNATQSNLGKHNLAKQWSERLAPGQQLKVTAGAAPQRYEVDATNAVSWSHGWLVFQSTPLSEAIAQINRYSNRQVTLADASLADLKIAGSFIAGDSDSIVNAMAEVLPIRVVDGGSREVLLFKRYDR